MRKLICCLLGIMLASTLSAQTGKGKYVGGDISLIPAYEEHNSPYLDTNGNAIDDLLVWLHDECQWNTFRVRLFVNPDGSDPAVCQDLDYVKALGKRIKALGAKFMLDFHYSDSWVDAGHIQAPVAWKNFTVDEKATKIAEYTTEVLQSLKANDAQPDLVQVGNEIMYGFMGIKVAPYDKADSRWDDFLKVLKAGCEAVRSECPEAKIIIHTDRPANADYAKYWYGKLDAAAVPYDVIGLSFYPFWHGNLTDLKKALTQMKYNFPEKKIQIVETAYNFQYWPGDANYDTRNIWAATSDGQYKFVKELIALLADFEQVEGLSYWCPEDAGNGDDTDWNTSNGTVMTGWTNRGLWWPSQSTTGHWPVTAAEGSIHYLLKTFLSEEAMGINSNENENENENIYDLSGRRLNSAPAKGLYIKQGRKVIR